MRLYKYIYIFFFLTISAAYAQNSNNSVLKTNKSNFILSYSSNCPDSLKQVVEYVTDIWSQYIYSQIPISIHVSWQNLASNIYAYANPTLLKQNIPELPFSDVSFPIALAEKITNTNFNFNEPDIELVVNSSMPWNFDFSTYPIPKKHDITTILLHEIAHGLGFIGNVIMKNSTFLIDNYPLVYDTFLSYKAHPFLSFFNNLHVSSDSLATIATSNEIVWNGAYTSAFLGFKPSLYAPSPYNQGSSFYHFNDDFIPPGDSLALMKRSFGANDIIHHPDIATLSLLADIGWFDFFLQHTPIKNVSSLQDSIFYTLTCNDAFIDTSFVEIMYSFDQGKNFISQQVRYNADSACFVGAFPPYPFERTVHYAIKTKSLNGDTIVFPPFFPSHMFSFFVGHDSNPPIINHKPPVKVLIDADVLKIRAEIHDDFSIDSSYIHVFIGRDDFSTIFYQDKILFQQDVFGFYADILLSDLPISADDQIAYNIFSVDSHGNESSFLPHGQYEILTIEQSRNPLHCFITDFEADSIQDYFYLDKFSIFKEEGFNSKALHTEHPYSSSYIDRQYVQYIAELKNPIIIADNPAIMEFDEIVLVEPSESPDIAYGMYGFWDYVVVEGTKNTASDEWYALGKAGYDSRYNVKWLSTFYSLLTPDNNNSSIAVGTQELFSRHTINLLENKYFRTGDTIFIRFRLQSDYNRHGWGWAIDNLSIQEKNTHTKTECEYSKECELYPNPLYSHVCIPQKCGVHSMRIFNVLGKEVLFIQKIVDDCIDVFELPPGVYNVVLETDSGVFVEKVIKL